MQISLAIHPNIIKYDIVVTNHQTLLNEPVKGLGLSWSEYRARPILVQALFKCLHARWAWEVHWALSG